MSAHRSFARIFIGMSISLVVGCQHSAAPLPTNSDSVSLEPVPSGFAAPVALAAPNDDTGRLFVVDQVGLIYVVDRDAGKLPTPFLDLHSRLVLLSPFYDERGLLGLAFHPQFRT